MKKLQVVLIGIGIASVAGLYLLPKVVVDNEATGEKMESGAEASPAITESHENELSSQNREQADQLISKFRSAPTPEEKVAAAQILAGIYKEEGLFDSAAYYWTEASTLWPDNLFLAEEAGKANYDAFSFALDKNKVEVLAEKNQRLLKSGVGKRSHPSRFEIQNSDDLRVFIQSDARNYLVARDSGGGSEE